MRRFFVTVATLGILIMPLSVKADAPDCDNNAVVWCGATSQSALMTAIANGDGHNTAINIASVYAQNSINTSQINQTVDGTVSKSGNVMVNGKVVATNAQSVGRQFMAGSTAQGAVWIRPTSISFASDNLQAFVLMQNNQFVWAIVKACGNPVLAKPVVAVTVGATPPPPPPVVTPPPPPPAIPRTGSNAMLVATLATLAMWLGLNAYRKSRRSLSRSLLKLQP